MPEPSRGFEAYGDGSTSPREGSGIGILHGSVLRYDNPLEPVDPVSWGKRHWIDPRGAAGVAQ